MKCLECKYARKTKNEDYVGCSYWYNQLGKSGMSEESYAQIVFNQEPSISSMAIGWAFAYLRPNSNGDSTVTSGLMWNNYYCVPKNDVCSKFESDN